MGRHCAGGFPAILLGALAAPMEGGAYHGGKIVREPAMYLSGRTGERILFE